MIRAADSRAPVPIMASTAKAAPPCIRCGPSHEYSSAARPR